MEPSQDNQTSILGQGVPPAAVTQLDAGSHKTSTSLQAVEHSSLQPHTATEVMPAQFVLDSTASTPPVHHQPEQGQHGLWQRTAGQRGVPDPYAAPFDQAVSLYGAAMTATPVHPSSTPKSKVLCGTNQHHAAGPSSMLGSPRLNPVMPDVPGTHPPLVRIETHDTSLQPDSKQPTYVFPTDNSAVPARHRQGTTGTDLTTSRTRLPLHGSQAEQTVDMQHDDMVSSKAGSVDPRDTPFAHHTCQQRLVRLTDDVLQLLLTRGMSSQHAQHNQHPLAPTSSVSPGGADATGVASATAANAAASKPWTHQQQGDSTSGLPSMYDVHHPSRPLSSMSSHPVMCQPFTSPLTLGPSSAGLPLSTISAEDDDRDAAGHVVAGGDATAMGRSPASLSSWDPIGSSSGLHHTGSRSHPAGHAVLSSSSQHLPPSGHVTLDHEYTWQHHRLDNQQTWQHHQQQQQQQWGQYAAGLQRMSDQTDKTRLYSSRSQPIAHFEQRPAVRSQHQHGTAAEHTTSDVLLSPRWTNVAPQARLTFDSRQKPSWSLQHLAASAATGHQHFSRQQPGPLAGTQTPAVLSIAADTPPSSLVRAHPPPQLQLPSGPMSPRAIAPPHGAHTANRSKEAEHFTRRHTPKATPAVLSQHHQQHQHQQQGSAVAAAVGSGQLTDMDIDVTPGQSGVNDQGLPAMLTKQGSTAAFGRAEHAGVGVSAADVAVAGGGDEGDDDSSEESTADDSGQTYSPPAGSPGMQSC